MSQVLISVVTPAYNASSFIGDAIRSVLTQSHHNLEHIVVDDGSTDGTADIAKSIADKRVRVIRQDNAGPSAARNLGLAHSSGEYVAFLDADDLWFPDKLERQIRALQCDREVAAVGCLMNYLSSSGRFLGIAGQPLSDADQARISEARLVPYPLSSTLFRRSVLDEVGGFDEVLRDAAEDLDLMARVSREGRFECIEEVLGVYRIHPDSLSVRRFSHQRSQGRFVRARLEEREKGKDLSWQEFIQSYRPSLRQRYDDAVHAWYRLAGLSAAERDWPKALMYGSLATIFGPRYTLKRLRRQRLGSLR